MNIFSIVGILIIPILTGVLIRIFVRKKPKTGLVIWGILMSMMLIFFIYSIILVFYQETPLFTKHHMANECFVISSAIFLFLGFLNVRNIKRTLADKHDEKKLQRRIVRTE
jgi:ACR3 family arsenite efflux pump ArsB